MAKDINIGGRLHSIATGNVVAGTDEILDDNLGKKQTQINTETYSLVESVNNALDALNPDQQEALAVAAKANANEAKLGYYVCDTDADVAAKTIAATGYVLGTGGNIRIKMTNANIADAVTLNINNTGAKALFYNDAQASSTNSWEAGEVIEVYYDGTQFMASNSQGGGGDAQKINYDNSQSGIAADNVQEALDVTNQKLTKSAGAEKTLTSIDFTQGSLNAADASEVTTPLRIRTGYIKVWQGLDISIILNGQQYIIYYFDEKKVYDYSTSWSFDDANITISHDGYIRMLIAKSNDGPITPSKLLASIVVNRGAISKLQEDITELQEDISELGNNYSKIENTLSNKLFLGTLVQKAMTNNELVDSTTRVSMQSCCTVPFVGATLRFTLPEHYFIGIRSGNRANRLDYNDFWYKNGDTYTFRSDVRYFRLCFAYSLIDPPTNPSQLDITVATVQALIDSNDIVIYEPNDISLFERNSASEKYAKAIMRPFVSGASNNYSLKKLPIFLHTSDVHGDAKRFENFMDYADYLEVDAALISGDMLAVDKNSSKVFIDDIASQHSIADLQCLGNHEAQNATIQEESEMLNSCIQRNSCVVNSNEQYPTYYYKDIAEKNMRIIALNLYSVSGNSETWRITQEQCEWLIATLASTPANYGVIVMMHAPEAIPLIDEQYGKFRQTILNYTNTGALSARPLANIIDAFIGKELRTITYTSHSTNISVSADFTSVNSGVEFIAYVNGHLHTDTIGFVPNTTHRQLVLNVCCCIGIYGTTNPYLANNSDLPRDAKGATQDSFNLYAIDRSSGTVRVAKIGSNITGNMETRDWMIIPYKLDN